MNFTGERPSLTDEVLSSRMRYKAVATFCTDKCVFDFGCGIGQGSFFLSHFARKVVGYDISKEAIDEATKQFSNDKVSFVNGFDQFKGSKFDIVTMVEVMEHVEMGSLDDVLRDFSASNCELIATTPNGDWFQYHPMRLEDRRGFHIWHYTEQELKTLFSKYFSFTEVFGQCRDPKISQFGVHTTYLVYACNRAWKDSWMTDVHMKI